MIRGKNNLIYNQKREIEEETDQYELIDGEDCEEEEENDA